MNNKTRFITLFLVGVLTTGCYTQFESLKDDPKEVVIKSYEKPNTAYFFRANSYVQRSSFWYNNYYPFWNIYGTPFLRDQYAFSRSCGIIFQNGSSLNRNSQPRSTGFYASGENNSRKDRSASTLLNRTQYMGERSGPERSDFIPRRSSLIAHENETHNVRSSGGTNPMRSQLKRRDLPDNIKDERIASSSTANLGKGADNERSSKRRSSTPLIRDGASVTISDPAAIRHFLSMAKQHSQNTSTQQMTNDRLSVAFFLSKMAQTPSQNRTLMTRSSRGGVYGARALPAKRTINGSSSYRGSSSSNNRSGTSVRTKSSSTRTGNSVRQTRSTSGSKGTRSRSSSSNNQRSSGSNN